MARDLYAALEVSPHATQEEIKKAHRRLVRDWHPDSHGTEAARERFLQIQQAYEVLSNPTLRAQYDRSQRRHGVATYRQNQSAADNAQQQKAEPVPAEASPLSAPAYHAVADWIRRTRRAAGAAYAALRTRLRR